MLIKTAPDLEINDVNSSQAGSLTNTARENAAPFKDSGLDFNKAGARRNSQHTFDKTSHSMLSNFQTSMLSPAP